MHFTLDAPPALTEDVKELAVDVGTEALEQRRAAGRRRPTRRRRPAQPADHGARKGDPIELVVDTHRLHFFDPDDGSGIYGSE